MKKCSPKRSCSPKKYLTGYSLILGCCFIIISCHNQTSTYVKNTTINKHEAKKNSEQYFLPPIVIPVTIQNQPAIIKAGKPVVKIDSSVSGIPFFTNYGTDDGLSINNVICGATDKAGNLWFGTGGGGVDRYDGKNFTNYTKSQGLAGNIVFYIMEDRGGNIWIGTTSGLSKYDGHRFINYSTLQGLADNFVTSIIQDSKRNLWFGTHDGGVSKYDGKNFTNYTEAQGLANNYVRCMIEDRKGNLWFGTDAGGVSKYDGSSFVNYTSVQGLAGNSVNCITQDNKGNLWFGTNTGLSKYDFKEFKNYTTKDGLVDNNIYCILQDKKKEFWFGTHTKGVSKYDGTSFRNYTKAEGLAENKISSIIQDRTGNVWVTSQGGGVSKYEGNSFAYYTTAQGLAGNLVFYITQDKAGNHWFGTYEGGTSKYDGKTFSNYAKQQGLPDISIWSIMTDRSGNIWFSSDRAGVCKYDGSSFTNYTTKQGLAADAVISMMQDTAGNIWFGTRASGVSKFDGKSFTNYSKAQGLAGNNIWSIIQDRAGNIWFGTHEDGASKYNGKSFINYTTSQGLPGNAITAIREDKNGNLWFGTDGQGLSKYDGNHFTNYTTEDGLADNTISFITEDTTRDIVWLGTNQGLSGIKEKTLLKNLPVIKFENFNKITGYPIKDVSTGGLFADDKGIVWAGSGDGKLIRFDYSSVNKRNAAALILEIQDVKVNNEAICWNHLLHLRSHNNATDSLTILNEMFTSFGKIIAPEALYKMGEKYKNIELDKVEKFYPVPINLVLPYEDNNITINFVAIDPAMQKQVQYQYKLDGYNNNWSQLSNATSAVFGNMKAGDYTFKLKAVNPFGVWSEKEYSFKVLPPLWATWWAITLYFLAAVATLYAFYRNTIKSVERKQAAQLKIIITTQEEERNRISRDLHDDIGARLTNMNIMSALGQKKVNEPLEMFEYLKRISKEVQTSAEALDDIVWSIDSQNDSIEELTARMRRYTADIFDGKSVTYSISVEQTLLPVKLSTGKRRDLFLLFKESINNIQKHAAAKEVKIKIESINDNLSMEVSDDGKGFDINQPTHRNGLKNMQQRISKWKGTLTVDSLPDKGVVVTVTLPISTPSLKKGMRNRRKNR